MGEDQSGSKELQDSNESLESKESQDSKESQECGNCGKPAETKCSKCKEVFYCKRECQLRDWKRGGHKEICNILQGQVQPRVTVKNSPLHGKGLFATENISKGTRVAYFKGDLKDSKVAVKMRKNRDGSLGVVEASTYFRSVAASDPDYDCIMSHPKKEGFMVVGREGQHDAEGCGFGLGQYVNDGASPSFDSRRLSDMDFAQASKELSEYQERSLDRMNCEVDKNLWFVTTKDVTAGQELLTHYGFEFWVHRPLVTSDGGDLNSVSPQAMLLLYALHDQSSKPFNLRQFFDYDRETIAAFLIDFCRMPPESVAKYKSPKDLVFELMELVQMMDPGAAELAASTS